MASRVPRGVSAAFTRGLPLVRPPRLAELLASNAQSGKRSIARAL